MEKFLLKYGIPLPSDDCNLSIQYEGQLNIQNNTLSMFQSHNDNVSLNKELLQSEIDKAENKLEIEHDKNITEINTKYIEVLDIVNNLEDEKADLESKLNEAMLRLNDFNLEKERKEKCLEELEKMKSDSDNKVELLESELKYIISAFEIRKNSIDYNKEVDIEIPSQTQKKQHYETNIIKSEEIMLINTRKSVLEPTSVINIEIVNCSKDKDRSKDYPDSLSYKQNRDLQEELISTMGPTSNNFLFTHDSNIHNNTMIHTEPNQLVIDDLFHKLKEYADKCPEINNLIDDYKNKLYINEEIMNRKNDSKSDENIIFNQQRKRTEDEQKSLIEELEIKAEKV